ncbi:hypothetical protein MED121_14219 [Marinomonas sp. MED121]|uniref:bifunctional diguanylate cyclase/phosphodiesterase n=1 Tax=Marinomonas sp. MED121 TaxID=314277 RepID=UPI0000690FF2|nr:EAL domain-containing protein [Marinomonas sp. MED121]EAQ67089.1 hypothetical protein MED121_14219 [Marinomonas sp. MED121]
MLKGRYLKQAHLIVFFFVFLCALIVLFSLLREDGKRIAANQQLASMQLEESILSSLNAYELDVTGLAAFFHASEFVSNHEFDTFSQTLINHQRTPIYNSFFAQSVLHQNKSAFVDQQIERDKGAFQILPEGQRREYLPITYAFPDKRFLGFDTLEPDVFLLNRTTQDWNNRQVKLLKPSASNPDVTIGQFETPGFYVLSKNVYQDVNDRSSNKENWLGVVAVSFDVASVLQSFNAKFDHDLLFRLSDLENANASKKYFYLSHPADFDQWQNKSFMGTEILYGGRVWLLETAYLGSSIALYDWNTILLPVVSLVLLAIFLSVYIRSLNTSFLSMMRRVNRQLEIDDLTNLYSRYFIHEKLDKAIIRCKEKQTNLAVVFMDLDHFKTVNEAFGHEVGDKLLNKVAQRLTSVWPADAVLGRLGGDEFLAFIELNEQMNHQDLKLLCREVITQVSHSYLIDSRTLTIGCSIGVALFPNFGSDAMTLVKNADMAMYKAKALGRSIYHFYDGDIGDRLARNVKIETRLRHAMQNDGLKLYFQPKVNLESLECIGLEALLRWRDEELGVVSPAEFIPIAEQSGIILPLGEWVIDQTCRQIFNWQAQGLSVPPIAINCSAAQLKRDDFFSVLLQSLNRYDISPSQVELEVTESMLIEDAERCSKLLQQVSRLGVKITIDDFGTGYSSLSYLKDLPFNCIKIDQVFIRDMIEDVNHAAITAAIIKMSQTLNLQVVAEGITNHKQLEVLRELGCNIGQGFLFGEAFHADHLAVNDEKIRKSLLAED